MKFGVHFGSRGGLMVALVRRADDREHIIENFEGALKETQPDARLDACLCVWFDFVVKIHPVALDLIRLRATDEEAANAWHDRMREMLRLCKLLADSLKKQNALAPEWSPTQAAEYIWAACSVQAWALLVFDRGWSAKRASETIRRVMRQTLLA